MRATVIVDNISSEGLPGEWGLCIYIEQDGRKLLLDTGGSELFLRNAAKLGIDLGAVEYAVLSHAHYDHANGMGAFFRENKQASFYLREGSQENCYGKKWIFHKYIGLPRHILEDYRDRIVFASGDMELFPGASLIPHKTPGLGAVGARNHMYIRTAQGWQPDDFAHEQSLVLETKEGLVIFNSCSHGGADNIIREVAETYPGRKIRAIIGGFHLFGKPEAEVRALAQRIRDTGIEQVYTGHCTGKRSYGILKEELGDRLRQFRVGLVIEI